MLHLPAALCHYTGGVATDAIVKVDMVLPIANKKRCREQETEEDGDSLSTSSTVDLHYPEEDDDSDEDDEDSEDEVCSMMTISKPPTEESESVRWWPDKNEWVASWKKSDQRQQFRTWISVFAYFDKNRGHGGYGVILRNALAQPITASAKFSKTGNCFFYQLFKGIKAGVKLAEEHGLSNFHAQCNSVVVPAIFKGARHCCDKECISTRDPERICQGCFTWFECFEGCDMDSVVPLVLELRRKNIVEMSCGFGTNKAAHYLAKREKKIRRHGVEKKEEWNPHDDDDKPSEIELDDFPQELKDILWRDAFGMSHFIVA